MALIENLERFTKLYEILMLYQRNEPPLVHFPPEAAQGFAQASELRKKNWQSSKRMLSRSDAVGLAGELAFFRYMGLSGDEALQEFMAGLKGDGGIDASFGDMQIDVKTTGVTSGSLRYAFSKTNRNANRANVVVFAHQQDMQDGACNVYLMGWAWKHEINPHMRQSPNYEHIHVIHLKTLQRLGLLHPVSHMTLHQVRGEQH